MWAIDLEVKVTKTIRANRVVLVVLTVFFFVTPEPLSAYVGPGTGLAVIGAALAFVASVVLGIFGFIWYPIKRALRAMFKKGSPPSDQINT